MARTFPDCPSCNQLDSQCEHRQQYEEAERHILKAYGALDIIDKSDDLPDGYWRAGLVYDYKIIWIWRTGCQLYGWSMLTSVLIHEYGHHLWFDESGERFPETVEDEEEANDYGFNAMPPELIPQHYRQHRRFFLGSYIAKKDTG